jgi:hypothetical protein
MANYDPDVQNELLNHFVEDLIENFDIEDSLFVRQALTLLLEDIPAEYYATLLTQMIGEEFRYVKPLDRVEKAVRVYHQKMSGEDERIDKAKKIAKTFDDVRAALIQAFNKERQTYQTEENFFKAINFATLKQGEERLLNDDALKVLDALGGWQWLLASQYYAFESDIIAKIANVLKSKQ